MRAYFVPLVALVWASLVAPAAASPPDLFGFGGRTVGLAMTGSSYADGYESVFANPAGLGPTRRRNLTIGFVGGGYQLQLDGENFPLTPARGINIGFTLPLPFGDILEDRLVFGAGFYTPAEVLLRGNIRFPQAVQWPVIDRAQVVSVMVGLGIDMHGVVDGLSIGVGVNALANVFGELAVRLDETSAFSSVVETQLVTSFAPNVGLQYQHPNPNGRPEWGLGLNYRHEVISRFELNIATSDLPVVLPVLTVGGIVQYDPSALVAEGFWRPVPELMLVLNLTTRFWSAYPGTQIPTTTMGLDAPGPDFSIIPAPRIAAEYTWEDANYMLQLRAGYAFEASPAPPARIANRRTVNGDPVPGNELPFRMLDNHRHVLTAGIGWTIKLGEEGQGIAIDAFGQLHVLQDRTHEIGQTDGAPPMESGGFIGQAGWSVGVFF